VPRLRAWARGEKLDSEAYTALKKQRAKRVA
jgi:hypothetical protein